MKFKRLTPLLILAIFLAGFMLGRKTDGKSVVPDHSPETVAVTATAAPTKKPKQELSLSQWSAAAAAIKPAPTPEKQTEEHEYVLNTNTHKFHYPDCYSVDQMKDSNKKYYTGTREEVIAMGYDPCGNCDP